MRMGAPFTVATTRSSNARESGMRPIVRRLSSRPPPRDVAARQVRVLARDRVAHGADGELVGGEPVGVDPHVDGAQQAADHPHLADAGGALHLHLDDLVRQLGQLAQRAVAGERDGHDRRGVVVDLGDDGRLRRPSAAWRGRWRRGRARPAWPRRCCGSATKVTMMIDLPAPEIERSSLMPSTVLTTSSIFCETCVSTSSVEAPGRSVRTETVGQVDLGEAIDARA